MRTCGSACLAGRSQVERSPPRPLTRYECPACYLPDTGATRSGEGRHQPHPNWQRSEVELDNGFWVRICQDEGYHCISTLTNPIGWRVSLLQTWFPFTPYSLVATVWKRKATNESNLFLRLTLVHREIMIWVSSLRIAVYLKYDASYRVGYYIAWFQNAKKKWKLKTFWYQKRLFLVCTFDWPITAHRLLNGHDVCHTAATLPLFQLQRPSLFLILVGDLTFPSCQTLTYVISH